MDQVKTETSVDNNEEYIDVAGDDADIQHLGANDPSIMRSNRFRRQRRQIEASPYGQFTRRIIQTRNVHLSDIEAYEEIDEDEVEEAEEITYNPDIETEISQDIKKIRETRTRTYAGGQPSEFSDYGPVKFKFDSTQRKKQVIVYNSIKFAGHASEWYFARRNNSTHNETYRCVQCRRYREEAKKGIRQDVENLPEARIMVQNDRFLTDPDEPLGKHICDFENNDRTTLQSVWSRRALSKANSELRLRPEKPKEKFNQLLREIQNGKEYAHLPLAVRQEIINELDSKKGFASRRRSFARNNRFGQQQYLGVGKGTLQTDSYGQIMYYLCGMDHCKERFGTPEERANHRNYYHSNVLFIDTKEELDEYNNYRRLHGNYVSGDELVVANEQIVLEDQIKNETAEQYEVIINDEDGENFYNQTCYLLESLRESSVNLLNDPVKREAMMNLLMECDRSCKELAQTASETVIDETADQSEDKVQTVETVEEEMQEEQPKDD